MNEHDERLLDAFRSCWRSIGYVSSTVANHRYDLRRLAQRRPLSECETSTSTPTSETQAVASAAATVVSVGAGVHGGSDPGAQGRDVDL
jgi:hypothetical protein